MGAAVARSLAQPAAPAGMLFASLGRVISNTAAKESATPVAAVAATSDVTATAIKEFSIYRWNPDEGGEPIFQKYHVDVNRCASASS